MNNLNEIPDDIYKHLAKYCGDKELFKLVQVDKKNNNLINENSKELKSNIAHQIHELNKKNFSNKEIFDNRISNSIFKRIVFFLNNSENVILSKICKILKTIFPSFANESYIQNRSQMAIKLEERDLLYLKTFYKYMSDLFGDMKNFENLPILDFKDEMMGVDYIDRVKPEHMTAPIMRGVDKWNRNFFTIRAKIDNRVFCQTFFERYTKDSLWTCGGPNIISSHTPLFARGKILNFTSYQQLQTILSTNELITPEHTITLC